MKKLYYYVVWSASLNSTFDCGMTGPFTDKDMAITDMRHFFTDALHNRGIDFNNFSDMHYGEFIVDAYRIHISNNVSMRAVNIENPVDAFMCKLITRF